MFIWDVPSDLRDSIPASKLHLLGREVKRMSMDLAAEGSRRVELRYQRECSLGCTRALSLAVIEQGMTCLAESEELYQPNADRFSYGRRMFDLKVDESASISKRRAGW